MIINTWLVWKTKSLLWPVSRMSVPCQFQHTERAKCETGRGHEAEGGYAPATPEASADLLPRLSLSSSGWETLVFIEGHLLLEGASTSLIWGYQILKGH